MCGEVINGDLHTLALLKFAQSGDQQLKVKGPRMIEVVVVARRQGLLFRRQILSKHNMQK